MGAEAAGRVPAVLRSLAGRVWAALLFASALTMSLAACHAEPLAAPPLAPAGPDAGVDAGCAGGATPRDAGGCQPAGLPLDLPCPPGETPIDGGACQAAGVPPDACAPGFVTDHDGGCVAILPGATCPAGQLAWPGETTCHAVAPCGSGDYGDIPIEADTQFVSAAFAGGSSDGTRARPWTSIRAGLAAAAPGAMVAVAAGSYAEDVLVSKKPARLWGRCPGLVEVTGAGKATAALRVEGPEASHAELHGLALTATAGVEGGLSVSGATGVVADRLWIHDTSGTGLDANDDLGVTSLSVSGSLIESATGIALTATGATATVDTSVVRDTRPAVVQPGRGILIQSKAGRRAHLTLTTCLVERNRIGGIIAFGSDLGVFGTVVRDTQTAEHGISGLGIGVIDLDGERGKTTVGACVLERNGAAGLVVLGSDALIEATVVRDSQGTGIDLEDDVGAEARVTLRSSLVSGNRSSGVLIRSTDLGIDVTIDATLVRATQLDDLDSGRGFDFEADCGRTKVTVTHSVAEHNHGAGVFVVGSTLLLEATRVSDTLPDSTAVGRGLDIEEGASPSLATIRSVLVEGSRDVGIVAFGSELQIESSVVRDSLADGQETTGDGILLVASLQGPVASRITGTLVQSSARAGLANFGTAVTLGSSVLVCSAFDLDGEPLGGEAFAFTSLGGNLCGCPGPTRECQAESAGFKPPQPL